MIGNEIFPFGNLISGVCNAYAWMTLPRRKEMARPFEFDELVGPI